MILTIGTSPALARSMIFDRVTIDGVNRAREVRVAAAGKSINVARVVRALGERVVAAGPIGGATGMELRDELDRAGVAHDFISVAAPTRVCVTVIDRSSHQTTELIEEPGAISDAESDALWTAVCKTLPQARVVVLTGTLAPGIPAGFYAMACRLAADLGVAAIVDAVGDPLTMTLPLRPWLVKPNRAELSTTLGRAIESDDDLYSAMRSLIDRGAQNVAITMGAAGAAYTDGATIWRATSPRIKPVSAIGSGDAFAAGMAVAHVRGLDRAAALRLAIACGAANALMPQAGFVDAPTVAELEKQVEIHAVAG